MFKNARIKLTAWYVVIIMVISLTFSAMINGMISREIHERFIVIERRLRIQDVHEFIEDQKNIQSKVFFSLFYINSTILVFSSIAGYFLAGKTLRPIEEALEDQKRFVADASHELKTPISTLQTSIEVTLRDKKLNLKEAKKSLSQNLIDIKRLNKLTHYLLNISKVDNSQNISEVINSEELILSVVKKFSIKRKIITKLKKVEIKGNYEELSQLIAIFVDNAIKYSDSDIYIHSIVKNNRLEISIKDNGIGISSEDLPQIFDRFYRVDRSRSKSIEGFGLGLSLAKSLAQRNNVQILVESKINKGSIFKLLLKLS